MYSEVGQSAVQVDLLLDDEEAGVDCLMPQKDPKI